MKEEKWLDLAGHWVVSQFGWIGPVEQVVTERVSARCFLEVGHSFWLREVSYGKRGGDWKTTAR